MKKVRIVFSYTGIVFFIAIVLNGCKEVGPVVPWGNNGNFTSTTYIETPAQPPQTKNALIEEITGVSCVNCPAAHVALDNLITANNNKVIGISYHVGPAIFNQDNLPPGSVQDMTSTDAQSVVGAPSLGGFPGYGPAGSVDRIVHQNVGPFAATSIWDVYADWGGYVTTELAEMPPVNIYLSSIYNATGSTKQINITVSLHYTAAQTDTDKLSIFLTEDSIVTAQLLSNGADDTFYVHNHIMRAAVTNPLGNVISVPTFVAGRVDSLAFSYVIPAADSVWNPKHMNVIAFVHKYLNGRSDILQSQTVKVTP